MKNRDSLQRFLFERQSVRGELVHLDATWRAVLERRPYPAPVQNLLGEAMAAAALLSATLKYKGKVSLQLQGEGLISLLLVQATADATLRGLAKFDEDLPDDAGFAELCKGGMLVITLDPGTGGEQYQGVVELKETSLAATLENYFENSEQLPTRLRLHADEHQAAGFLLQKLPEKDDEDADDWNRIQLLGETLKEEELLNLDAAEIIHRLYHEETVRLFDAEPRSFRCNCSRERSGNMLRGLGIEDVREVIAERGDVEVGCDFCGMQYRFDSVDAEALFADIVSDVPDTQQ